jgi:hypothetical protein
MKWALRACGGAAEFIVLYLWSPAHRDTPQHGSVDQSTNGASSPALNGNGNTITGRSAK